MRRDSNAASIAPILPNHGLILPAADRRQQGDFRAGRDRHAVVREFVVDRERRFFQQPGGIRIRSIKRRRNSPIVSGIGRRDFDAIGADQVPRTARTKERSSQHQLPQRLLQPIRDFRNQAVRQRQILHRMQRSLPGPVFHLHSATAALG